jgi:catechol 2,3-dioxygenase-like lactoylglutathione lyase family enzyme
VQIDRLDHLVLTVKDLDDTAKFYERVLGMEKIIFGDNRFALKFGQQKINLHQLGNEFEPKAQNVMSGSADLCFITSTPINDVISHIEQCDVTVIEGPVKRTGATGNIISAYIRDPDENLIEISNYTGI